jgi:hypothetical protein
MKLLSNLVVDYLAVASFLAFGLAVVGALVRSRRYRWLGLMGTVAALAINVVEGHRWCIVLWSVLLAVDLYLNALFYNVVRFVKSGDMLPRFYGLAWMEVDRKGAMCAPVPLNVLMAVIYFSWNWAKNGCRQVPLTLHAAYEQGRFDERKKWMPTPSEAKTAK